MERLAQLGAVTNLFSRLSKLNPSSECLALSTISPAMHLKRKVEFFHCHRALGTASSQVNVTPWMIFLSTSLKSNYSSWRMVIRQYYGLYVHLPHQNRYCFAGVAPSSGSEPQQTSELAQNQLHSEIS